MFSSLIRRPKPGSRRVFVRESNFSPSPGPSTRRRDSVRRHATADFTEAEDDEDEESNDGRARQYNDQADEEDDDGEGDGDVVDDDAEPGDRRARLPVLPLFSSSHLGSIIVPRLIPLESSLADLESL